MSYSDVVRPQSAVRFSCELFPPKDLDSHAFWRCVGGLDTLRPEFISLTHGALGAGTDSNFAVLTSLSAETSAPMAAHLTCIGRTRADLVRDLNALSELGITHIVALRGDHASNSPTNGNGFQHAEELVHLCAEVGDFEISVGAYPETHPDAKSPLADLKFLQAKLNAGATRAITQFFFDPSAFLNFRDNAIKLGIEHNLVPGVLPIANFAKVAGFAQKCGTHVPVKIARQFEALNDDVQGSKEFAHTLIAGMCEELLSEGVQDFHFYTLNRSDLTQQIVEHLQACTPAPKTAVA